jgi:hypothetical protein
LGEMESHGGSRSSTIEKGSSSYIQKINNHWPSERLPALRRYYLITAFIAHKGNHPRSR